MKKKYLLIELILVFFLLVIPPIFISSPPPLEPKRTFPFEALIEFLIALVLYFQSRNQKFSYRKEEFSKKREFSSLISGLKYSPLSLGFLMLIFAFFQVIALVFHLEEEGSSFILLPPNSFTSWLRLSFIFLAGAFFEEEVYRDFIPESLIYLSKKGRVFFEILSILLFALAHRYMGFLSVINALLCAVFLRFFRLKSGSIIPTATSHFIYNMTLAVFYVLI